LAKPYAKKLENIALVRDGDKDCLVTGYWCMEAYALDKDGVIGPLILWPYSLEADGQPCCLELASRDAEACL